MYLGLELRKTAQIIHYQFLSFATVGMEMVVQADLLHNVSVFTSSKGSILSSR